MISGLELVTLGLALGDADHHVSEEGGNNRGERVKRYLKAAGITVPAPWCAAWVNERAQLAADMLGTVSPLEQVKLQALVQSYHNWATENWLLVKDPRPGDLVLFKFGKSGRWDHIGFVVRPLDGNVFDTVEGNTSPGVGATDLEKQREGDGVFIKQRKLYSYPVEFVRWAL